MIASPLARLALGASALLLAAACGGGVSTKDPFTPARIVVFGDDLSVLVKAGGAFKTGAKYSLNIISATDTTQYDCGAYPIWSQTLAANYGMAFEECNPGIEATPRARTFAEAGKDVAGVAAQIDAFQAAGGSFADTFLVTVQAGMFDVKNAYEAYRDQKTQTFDAARAQVQAAGVALGKRIKRVTDDGGKVIFMTLPDLSLSPWAIARDANEVLILVKDFNEKLRVTVPNDGRKVGLVEADARTKLAHDNASAFGLVDVSTGVCDPAKTGGLLPNCANGTTLIGSVADGNTYLWADEIHIGSRLHADLGSVAYSRARNNPF